MGTIDYVAPEQIRGEPVDGRADVYALGCLLYEALTGERPYDRSSDVATIFAHLEEEPRTCQRAWPGAAAGDRRRPRPRDGERARRPLRDMRRSGRGRAGRARGRHSAAHEVGTRRRAARGTRAGRRRGGGRRGRRDSRVREPTSTPVRRDRQDRYGVGKGRRTAIALPSVPIHVTTAAGDVWFADGEALWRLDPDGGEPVKVETVGAIDDLTSLGDTVYVAHAGKDLQRRAGRAVLRRRHPR